jgi:hypothetical protein
VDWLVEANVSEKRIDSIFRAVVTMLGIIVGFYQPVHTAPKPRRTSLSLVCCFHPTNKQHDIEVELLTWLNPSRIPAVMTAY